MSYCSQLKGHGLSSATIAFVQDVLSRPLSGLSPVDRLTVECVVEETLDSTLFDSPYSDPDFILRHFPGCSPELFRELYQVGSLLSKFVVRNREDDEKRFCAAVDELDRTEGECALTNARLYDFWSKPMPEWVRTCVRYAQLEVAEWCRRCPELTLEAALRDGSFGSGASVNLPRRRGDAAFKFGLERPGVTHNLLPLIKTAIDEVAPLWGRLIEYPSGCDGNEVTTVPKKRDIDRGIAMEPELNGFMQRGIGSNLRVGLYRCGINLWNQDLNQILAFQGSLDGTLSTLDLRSASNTVSTGVVDLLFEKVPDVRNLLFSLRSPIGTLRPKFGVSRRWIWEHFSSMGNGFTFELESGIFFSLARAITRYLKCQDKRLGVYGDDIIIPSEASSMLIELLEMLGFETNIKKSFVSGPFRESCGAHYYRGHDVTPIFVRKDLKDPIVSHSMHNQCIQRGITNHDGEWRCPEWQHVADRLRRSTQKWANVSVPCTFGTGFWTSFDQATAVKRWRQRYGLEGMYTFQHVCPIRRVVERNWMGSLVASLHGMEAKQRAATDPLHSEPDPFGIPDREVGVKYVRRRAVSYGWSDLPPLFE